MSVGAPPGPRRANQFALLAQRRFGPFFWVQFLGAGNDNLFKFAFTVLVTYQLQVSWMEPKMVISESLSRTTQIGGLAKAGADRTSARTAPPRILSAGISGRRRWSGRPGPRGR